MLQDGKLVHVLEVERELHFLSTLFLYAEYTFEYGAIIQKVLTNLIHDHGIWLSKSLNSVRDMGLQVSKLKHGLNEPVSRAKTIINHMVSIA